jgi:hypothetical protein
MDEYGKAASPFSPSVSIHSSDQFGLGDERHQIVMWIPPVLSGANPSLGATFSPREIESLTMKAGTVTTTTSLSPFHSLGVDF